MQALVTEFVRVLTRCCLPACLPTCLPAYLPACRGRLVRSVVVRSTGQVVGGRRCS